MNGRSAAVAAGLAVVLLTGIPVGAGGEGEPLVIPAARVGDAWTMGVMDLSWDLRAAEMGTAVDALGLQRTALLIDVDGPHPITSELKEVTRHTIAVDAASGVSVADVTAWEFAGDSEPGTYASYEPNNPDGWPGWVLGGGLLTGRTLSDGAVVEVPLVMTSTRRADRIALAVEEIPAGPWGRCARATGTIRYPEWITSDGGEYQRRTLDLELRTQVCEGSPYAISTELRFDTESSGWDVTAELEGLSRGTGEGVTAGPFSGADRNVAAASAPFDGALHDGGPLPVWSVEEAQEAASLAPGLSAWRLLHPDGYLVEAHYTAPEGQVGSEAGAGADQWRLVHAAPSGAHHIVLAQRRAGVVTAVDVPQAGRYPQAVPSVEEWPDEIVTAAGVVQAWRLHAGFAATPTGLRWEPLLNDRWHITGQLAATCGDTCSATVTTEMPYRFDSGAAETGEHPLRPA